MKYPDFAFFTHRTKLAKLCAAVMTGGVLLSACSTMPEKDAAQAFKDSIQQSFDGNASYNFSTEQRIKLVPKQIAIVDAEAQAAVATVSKTYDDCDAAYDEAIAKAVVDTEEEIEQDYYDCLDEVDAQDDSVDDFDSDIRHAMTPKRIEAINKYVLEPMLTRIDGAYDANAKQMQLTYAFEYRPKNFTLAAKIPLLIDLNDVSVTFDPALALPILGTVFAEEVGTDWEGKAVKFYLPEEFAEQIPVNLLARTLSRSIVEAYGGIEDKQFSYVAKDDFAKSTGASKVVNLKMTPQVQLGLVDRLLSEWVKQVEIEAKLHPEEIKNPEAFEGVLEMVKELTAEGLFGEKGLLAEEVSSDALTSLLATTDYSVHLDRRGRMVGFNVLQNMTALADMINADVQSSSTGRITNYGKPVFAFRPTAEQTVDGNKLVMDLMEKYPDGLNSSNDDDTASDDAAWDAYDAAFEDCMAAANYGEGLEDDAFLVLEENCTMAAEVAYDEAASTQDIAQAAAEVVQAQDAAAVAACHAAYYANMAAEGHQISETDEQAVSELCADGAEVVSEDLLDDVEAEESPDDSALKEFCDKEAKYKKSAMCKGVQ